MAKLSVRQPAVAGQFYPRDPELLEQQIEQRLDEATLPDDLGPVQAIIAPHAGYIYSGATAAYAYKALSQLPKRRWTIFLLGPAHRVPVEGVALGEYRALQTPLGEISVAADRVAAMVSRSPHYVRAPHAHVPEHSLEVQLPFLQLTLPDVQVVPMLFGQTDVDAVAADLVDHLGEDDLIVVSSDLSHFYPQQQAEKLDHSLLDALMEGDISGVMHGEACGRAPIAVVMEIAQRKGWQPHLLDYRTSGDTAGDTSQVVGYAAVAYTA
jgi:hypothetical protein